jgi:large-conductance mechanosensitive channel
MTDLASKRAATDQGTLTCIDKEKGFLLKAAGLYFLIVLPVNKFAAQRAAAPPPPPLPTPTETLLVEIRDLLKRQTA